MESKSVLVVEDDDKIRAALVAALERARFRVRAAANVADAKEAGGQLGEDLDVVVLDMRLDDPNAPGVTGADVGIEIRRARRYPPEFVINSGYAEADYYRLALELGAAVYLNKLQDLSSVVNHTRVMALRRAMSANSEQRLQKIAEASRTAVEAASRFCRDVLAPELTRTLGCSYTLLLGHRMTTSVCATDDGGLPEGLNDVLARVQALTFGDSARPPVSMTLKLLAVGAEDYAKCARLDGAWSLALAEARGLYLSLVLFPNAERSAADSKFREELSHVLAKYFPGAVLELLLRVLADLTIVDNRRRATIDAIAGFCDRVGGEQDEIVSAAADSGEIRQEGETPNIGRLLELGGDLREAGAILHSLARRSVTGEGVGHPIDRQINVRSVLQRAWQEFVGGTGFPDPGMLHITGDCVVDGFRSDLQAALGQILRWLAQRRIETPEGASPFVTVDCRSSEHESVVEFQDASVRLDQSLRDHMFQPFATADQASGRGGRLGLYLAKIELELGHGGSVEDRSNDAPRGVGHWFVLRLPQAGTI